MKSTRLLWAFPLALILAGCKAEEPASPDPGYTSDGIRTETEADGGQEAQAGFIPGTATVQFSEQMTLAIEKGRADAELASVKETLGIISMQRVFPDAGEFEERTRREGLHRFYHIEYDKSVPLDKAVSMFESMEGVDLVEGNRKVKSLDVADPYYNKQWALNGTYDINVDEAWAFSTGNPDVIVCVVDGGIQLDHPDLAYNVGSRNYNFARKSYTINGENHGTHVAGIIAATRNNDYGIAGIAGGDYAAGRKGITLQSAQVFDGKSSADNFGTAIKWGADNGAVISQNSWGYDFDYDQDGKLSASEKQAALAAVTSSTDRAAIDYFIKYAGTDNDGNQLTGSPMKGGVVVFAAGNDGLSNGIPGAYEPNIAVGATTKSGVTANYSNYGDWVDICAPGSDIYSTISGSAYTSYSGTSMACPHVAGACALLVSIFGGEGFTNADLEEILINGARSNYISYLAHNTGPYLDLKGSTYYGLDKYKREENNDPVISTDYDGDFVFCQYQTVRIPFKVEDPDGDAVSVSGDFEGRGTIKQDTDDKSLWYFELVGELVSDFTPKAGKIVARDLYGGEAEYEFTYQVLENRAPVAEGTIDDRIIIGIGKTEVIDLEGLFSDPDGETPTLTAKAVPVASAAVSVDDGKLKIIPKVFGATDVTITATDYLKAKAQVTFRFLVREKDVEMDFYPNPVMDRLYIRGGVATEKADIRLINSAGSEVYHNELVCSAFSPAIVNMTDFAPGMYTLKVVLAAGEFTHNIVKR